MWLIKQSNPFGRCVFAAGLCLALSACENPFSDDAPSLDEVLSRGWLFGEDTADMPPPPAQPLYCYETIGDDDCHDAPLLDGGNRLIGYRGPPPLDPLQPKRP